MQCSSRSYSYVFLGVRQSKFRHLEGSSLHKSLHISNLRNLSKNVPGESDAFHVNSKFAAVPLGGPGGLIAILKVSYIPWFCLLHCSLPQPICLLWSCLAAEWRRALTWHWGVCCAEWILHKWLCLWSIWWAQIGCRWVNMDLILWTPFSQLLYLPSPLLGCEDAKIRIWIIPPEGLNETLRESDSYLSG